MPWNVAVSTGSSGLLVIDLDAGRGASAPPQWAGAHGGYDVLERLAAAAGEPPPSDTYTVATPGGLHLYFRQPSGVRLRNTQGALGWRIDTRGHGGYVIAAGSVRPEGLYRVAKRSPVAELPDWLITVLTPPPAPTPPAQHRTSKTPPLCRSGQASCRAPHCPASTNRGQVR